jgi:Flp pilus assembly protein TadG
MRGILTFLRDDRGSQTIEFILWIPIFVALLTIVIDATTLYLTHTEMSNVARDTARRMTAGYILNKADAEAHAASAMNLRDYPYVVSAAYDLNTGVEVVIAVKVKDMSIIGYLSPLTILGGTITSRVVMRPDPDIPFDTSDGGKGKG